MAKPIKVFHGGRGMKVAVWDNGDKGTSATVEGPQYKDNEGNWKSGSVFHTDLPGYIRMLTRAMVFMEEFAETREQ